MRKIRINVPRMEVVAQFVSRLFLSDRGICSDGDDSLGAAFEYSVLQYDISGGPYFGLVREIRARTTVI